MQTEKSIELERPVDEVFEYVVHNVEEWSIVVETDEIIEEKPGYVGTTFRTVTQDRGQQMEFVGAVTEHTPPTLHAVQMVGKHFNMRVTYTFEDLGGGRTRLTHFSDVEAKGFLKVLFFFMRPFMKNAGCDSLEKELENIKRLVEAK